MDTTEHARRRKVRRHAPALRAQVLAECAQPGASVARVALRHGLNANLVHKWRRQQRAVAPGDAGGGEFIALPLEATATAQSTAGGEIAAQDIRVQLRRGATTIDISWPVQAAGECAAWIAQWLR